VTRPTALNYVTCPYAKKGGWMAGYHTGIDYRAPVGTDIYATKGGKVVHSGYGGSYGPSYGSYVVIQSWYKGRFRQHLYAHLSSTKVREGQRVKAGDLIGLSGTTGNTNGPHLHYEERVSPFNYWSHCKPVFPTWTPVSRKIRKRLRKRIGVR
jgi:murein DD-endopeptidase MepM/ murein hydrolase activator NlpD